LSTGEARIIGVGREISAQRRDGSVFPASVAVGQVGGADPPRFVGFIRDITTLSHAIDELRRERDRAQRSEEQLQHAQELANLGNFDIHVPSMPDDYCSPQLLRILGLEKRYGAAAIADLLHDAVHPDDRENFRQAWRDALSRVRRLDIEYRIRRPDSGVRRVHMLAEVSSSAQGVRLMGALHDITERNEALEQVWRAGAARTCGSAEYHGRDGRGSSHEINQPLMAIATMRTPASDCWSDQPCYAELREARRRSASRRCGPGVIRRLRSMVRSREFRRETIDCNELIQTSLRSRSRCSRRRARHARPGARLPSVTGDPIQPQQVLLNPVRNRTRWRAARVRSGDRRSNRPERRRRRGDRRDRPRAGSARCRSQIVHAVLHDQGTGTVRAGDQQHHHAAHGGRLGYR
jgi:two-component system sensor kinase FixL